MFTTEAQSAQSELIFLPDRETAIGQNYAALRADPLAPGRCRPKLKLCFESAPAEGGGTFPWPSSPGQGKIHLLCDLCVSVVNSSTSPLYGPSLLLIQPLLHRLDQEWPGYGGIAENLGETPSILGSHEFSPRDPLRVSATTQPAPICWLRAYPDSIVKLF